MKDLNHQLIKLEDLYQELSNKVRYNKYSRTTIKQWIKTFKKIKMLNNIIKYRETRAYTSKINDNLT